MKAQSVLENMRFERGGLNTREETLDRILDRKITIELEAANVIVDAKGEVSRGQKYPDNDYFLDVIKNSGVEWEQISAGYGYGGIPFRFRGTKKQLLPIIGMWDAHSRDEEELAEELEDWDGSEEALWEIIG